MFNSFFLEQFFKMANAFIDAQQAKETKQTVWMSNASLDGENVVLQAETESTLKLMQDALKASNPNVKFTTNVVVLGRGTVEVLSPEQYAKHTVQSERKNLERKIQQLQKQKEDAVRKEDYETASNLKKQIDELTNTKQS